jgi:predicted aminopeptidase
VIKRVKPALVVLLLTPMFSAGCYYMQAARGQIEVLSKREPIEEILKDPGTPEDLERRLLLVQEARRFSVEALGLPDNDSYRTYSDLERDYVVWNVFAASEFSVEPRQWCYPIVGCVSYRGYFSRESAHKEADRLREDGFDVTVGGVPAYSTLGNFDDPILNTMMRWDDIQLVSTLFHELAHQVLYIKDDTAFNESFATAVEEFGIERWLDANGRDDEMSNYHRRKDLHRRLVELVNVARSDLREIYGGGLDDESMRGAKAARFERLASDVRRELEDAGRDGGHWLSNDLNNARLLPMSLYDGFVPAFRNLLAECAGDIDCFYEQAIEISELEPDERNARLNELAGT